MTPEQIEQALSRLESLSESLQEKLKAVEQDETLSPAGKDERRRQLRGEIESEAIRLEGELSVAIQQRLQQLEAELGDEQRRFFDFGSAGAVSGNGDLKSSMSAIVDRLDAYLRRNDLRERWNLMSGREMLSHYQERLAQDDRPIIELYEFEAPRVLNSRGDADGETALRAAISQARELRVTDRMKSLQQAKERAQVFQIRLQNALAQIRETLHTV